MTTLEGILFDLDGTLLDTHEDMAYALNTVLDNHQREPLPVEVIRPFVSKGAMVLVCLAFKCKPGSEEAKNLWKEYLDVYENNICIHTQLFDGMQQVLEDIETRSLSWGIVTNKPGYLTVQLLMELGLDTRAGTVVSGDTLPQKKPHPAPLLHASKILGLAADNCAYVGDDERDIIAGRSAGMKTIAAAYGYIVAEEKAEDWEADFLVNHPADISRWISNHDKH